MILLIRSRSGPEQSQSVANWMILLPQASPYDFSDSGFDITRIHADQKTRLWTDDYTFVLPYMHWE